jgi:lipopolysaccharide biosynthesis glycosyltransferase
MSRPITVVYAFDRNFAQYAAVSTHSLVCSTKSPLQIFWLIPDTDALHVQPIAASLASRTSSEIRVLSVSMDEIGTWKQAGHFSLAMYLRLLIPGLIDESRAIYLDADTLVLSDLGALFSQDFGDALIAGVPDPGVDRSRSIPLRDDDPYLNSGVLLMNLDALRHDGMLDKVRAIHAEHGHRLIWPDQCILNKYAEGRKFKLPGGWNRLISGLDITEAQFEGVLAEAGLSIIHFANKVKPWQAWCNPCVGEFWWNHADRAQVDGLVMQEITTVDQATLYAAMLEKNERYKEASDVKGKIIERLNQLLDECNDRAQDACATQA